ncbi:MAG: AAA family ATPase [Candidatus Lokiarchaeota archaeon]|nr:AAA family ATPase [Candidatus Lokiarchaeota archaeon]MBD3337500.1 AAA family ATPase [Candidatus Lokiarchaeota archaeon]
MGEVLRKAKKVRVKDSFKEDAGRGIVRIDPEIITDLNLKSGDAIEIHHTIDNKRTAALVAMGKPEDAGANIIRIDPSLRRNLGAAVDDYVEIGKIEAIAAKTLTFAGFEQSFLIRDPHLLVRKLEKRVVTKEDILSFYAMGHRIDLVIIDYTPDAKVVMIDLNTMIKFVDKDYRKSFKEKPSRIRYEAVTELEEEMQKIRERVTYEDIGGLENVIQKVREMIELPLRHPELFKKIGIEPPKGVLLHGPPGTGKTLLARAVASETNAHFISVSGPEIMSKFFGQSEENLRNIFEEAKKNAPSIIFLDELDSIAPKRDEGKGLVESRVVAQLLSLMDGIEDRGEIIVIAVTNKINNVDEALRRPGRFDREIEIGVPDVNGRYEILLIHTRGMPLNRDVDLKLISEKTHGFIGADIKALVKEAAMLAIREIIPELDLDIQIPQEILDKLKLKMSHFIRALNSIEPSALREVLITKPTETWDDIGGLEEAKQQLREVIEWPLKYPNFYKYMESKPPHGVILFGLPGTGKTLLAKALAHETELNFISVKGPEFLSKWVGESAKAVRDTFRKARTAAPCIVFFDEIDAIAVRRSENSSSRVVEQVVAQLLTEMDGLESLKNVILLAATNRPDMLDPALLRSGRFGRHIEVPLPNKRSREIIFKIHIENRPLNKKVNIEELSERLEGYTGADIKEICEEATIYAIRRGILKKYVMDHNPETFKKITITEHDFKKAIDKITQGAKRAKKSYKETVKEPIENIYG